MTTDVPTSTTPPPQPPLPPAPHKAHILVTGASSGLGRAFFEHFSSFPPTTHQVRGIDARPYPTHLTASSCEVGACGRFNQVDLTAEALVQKFVRNATVPGVAKSRSHSRSASTSRTPVSPTITYRDRHHHHHHHHHDSRQQQLSVPAGSQSSAAPTPPPSSSSTTSSPPPDHRPPENNGSNGDGDPAAAIPVAPDASPFTLVIHSAGIRGLVPSHEAARPDDIAGAETIAAMDAATMRRAYEINAVATFTLIKALLPSLCSSSSSPSPDSKPKIVIMASRMGSVSSNGDDAAGGGGGGGSSAMAGGAYAYRASKAALNAIVRSFSHDVPEVDFALIHPGRVQTGLVRTKEEGAIDVRESVADVLRLIDRLGAEEGLGSGCFVDRWGNAIPW